jgi:hypothetical protein
MARRVNKVQVNLGSYPYYVIMGVRKVGKTTLFKDLVDYLYPNNPEKGLLISCGGEDGYKALHNLSYEPAKVWSMEENEDGDRGFVQICDELISLRGTDEQVDLVAIDTLDELVEVATEKVYDEHRDKKMKKPTSLNEALGGYGAGHRRVAKLIEEQLQRLNEAGMAVFVIAHTKVKEQTDPLTGDPYEMITNNLDSRFYAPIANKAQMVVNIVMDRNVAGVGTETKKVKEKEIEVITAGRQTSLERYMYFRENLFVDAGGRFSGLPEKLPLSAKNFMLAFETGVKNSMGDSISNYDIEKQNEEEAQKNIEAGIKLHKKEQHDKKIEISTQIQTFMMDKPSQEIIDEFNKKVKKYKIKGFDSKSLESIDITELEDILSIFK